MTTDLDVIVIGAGQGGLSVSYYLTQKGIDHVVLERGRIGHSWRSERWDSFCLVTPNWTIRLPGAHYQGDDPDGFMSRDDFIGYLVSWAQGFGAPVREHVDVRSVSGEPGAFKVATSAGLLTAKAVIVATATHQHPKIPAFARKIPATILQFNITQYKHPNQLPNGAVMIVGSGQTGCQLAEELHEEGRKVFLCVGHAGRIPRRYRGADCLKWQRD